MKLWSRFSRPSELNDTENENLNSEPALEIYASDQGYGRRGTVSCCRNRNLARIAVAGSQPGDDTTSAHRTVRGRPHDVRLERRRAGGATGPAARHQARAFCLDLVSSSASTTVPDSRRLLACPMAGGP